MNSMRRNVFLVRSSKNENGVFDYELNERKQRRIDHAMHLIDSLLTFKSKSLRENAITNLALFCDLQEVRTKLNSIYKTIDDKELKVLIKKLYEGKIDTSDLEKLRDELLEEEKFIEEFMRDDNDFEDLKV